MFKSYFSRIFNYFLVMDGCALDLVTPPEGIMPIGYRGIVVTSTVTEHVRHICMMIVENYLGIFYFLFFLSE